MLKPKYVHTERLRLVPIHPDNASDLLVIYQDPAVKLRVGEWTLEMMREAANRYNNEWYEHPDHITRWIAYHNTDGHAVGCGGLTHTVIEWETYLKLDWLIREEYLAQDYREELIRAAFHVAFNELETDEIIAIARESDKALQAEIEAFGFAYNRTFLRPLEPYIMYTLTRNDYIKNSISQGLS